MFSRTSYLSVKVNVSRIIYLSGTELEMSFVLLALPQPKYQEARILGAKLEVSLGKNAKTIEY